MNLGHAQVGTTVIGLGLLVFGVYLGVEHVEQGQSWSVWSVTVVLAPMGAGLLFALRGPTERIVRQMAPYLPFLEEPETDNG